MYTHRHDRHLGRRSKRHLGLVLQRFGERVRREHVDDAKIERVLFVADAEQGGVVLDAGTSEEGDVVGDGIGDDLRGRQYVI